MRPLRQPVVFLALAVFAGPTPSQSLPLLDCGTQRLGASTRAALAAVARGELPPRVAPSVPAGVTPPPGAPGLVGPTDILVFEDAGAVLVTPFSDFALLGIMADATNQLLLEYGDQFDFVGFYLDFVPDHTIGQAFYYPITNDVSGIGNPFQDYGTGPFTDNHAQLGIGGSRLQGMIMMWNVNGVWEAGTGTPGSDFTRLALQHEQEHRFACYLTPLTGNKPLQGDWSDCGPSSHWNFRVDAQGGSLYMAEWVGTNPAVPTQFGVSFNNDIPGGAFSYVDLYLMGMVSPAEMDAGLSEFRYMNQSDCTGDHSGSITTLTSADLIANDGARVPSSASSQKDFTMGWIMIHQPGSPPTAASLAKAASILNQNTADFAAGTLGIGSMDNTLPSGWTDLGAGLAGFGGQVPSLVGAGSLAADTLATLTLGDARPLATTFWVLGFAALNAPFKGGVLVPQPDVFVPLATDGAGSLVVSGLIPPGVPGGSQLWVQEWVQDPDGPQGWAASNGLLGTTP